MDVQVEEEAALDTEVGYVEARDDDVGENSLINYQITGKKGPDESKRINGEGECRGTGDLQEKRERRGRSEVKNKRNQLMSVLHYRRKY